ncbi:hypothetical protein LSTR_LSTR012170 [Laodelphax striatellus]|uniref:Uncharacterized protein n=1 Tax=Laodelphax striatellus TaxID=195883 RepID=A0A482WXL5_LAOST|nr:hypothetical protein LSTR_LSTR012170 [Laodelphax striatellus]
MAVGNFKALNISALEKYFFMDVPKLSLTIDGEAKCLKQQGVQYEIPQHFKPEIYELDRYQNVVKFGEKDFSKYFTILERVVWRCTGGMDAFYQIENEIVSRTEVSKFIFSSLSLMEYVYSISLEEGTGIRFREIKLFDVSTGRPIIKYNGEISYTDVFERSSTFSHAPNHKDISFKLSSKAVYRTFISTHGYDLRIGSLVKGPFAADLTQEPTSVDCTQEGIDYNTLNTEGLLDTKIKVKINKNGMTHAMKRVRPSDDYFTITRKRVWKCSKSSSVAFLRVVNELKISKLFGSWKLLMESKLLMV